MTHVELVRQDTGAAWGHAEEGLQQRGLGSRLGHSDDAEVTVLQSRAHGSSHRIQNGRFFS